MNDQRWLELEFAVLLGIALLGLAKGLAYAWHALAAWL